MKPAALALPMLVAVLPAAAQVPAVLYTGNGYLQPTGQSEANVLNGVQDANSGWFSFTSQGQGFFDPGAGYQTIVSNQDRTFGVFLNGTSLWIGLADYGGQFTANRNGNSILQSFCCLNWDGNTHTAEFQYDTNVRWIGAWHDAQPMSPGDSGQTGSGWWLLDA